MTDRGWMQEDAEGKITFHPSKDAQTTQQWISIKDEPPRMGECVLLLRTWPKGTMLICRADPLGACDVFVGGVIYDDHYVSRERQYEERVLSHITHWMPLPKPPKEKS